jgi:hypothetical protein
MNQAEQVVVVAQEVTDALETEGQIEASKERLAEVQQNQITQNLLSIGKAIGRVQSAQIFGNVANSIQVTQLRKLKEECKAIDLTWGQACELIGVSRRTADMYLKMAADLGEDFFGNCRQIGLSFRTLDAARQLPAPVRDKLTTGEVVDLEEVSKEQLTRVIKDLAEEHAAEKAELKKSKENADKAFEKVLEQAEANAERANKLQAENKALSKGLEPGESETLELIKEKELELSLWMIRIKATEKISSMSPELYSRLTGSLRYMKLLTEAIESHVHNEWLPTGQHNEEDVFSSVNEQDQILAESDGRGPYMV